MDPTITPSKSIDIGMRQLRALANMPPMQRWDVIASGLPILLNSAEGLYAASRANDENARVREILESHAAEEAAKILILLDYVRCPLGMSEQAQRMLRVFYDHGTRLIYAAACNWRPTDVNELRTYVDRERASHYIEGYAGEYILPNSRLYNREARLYSDLTRNSDGSFEWNDPARRFAIDRIWDFLPSVLRVAKALQRLGAFGADGLNIIHRAWSEKPFTGPEHAMESDALIKETIGALIESKLVGDDAVQQDVTTVYDCWQIPMYAIKTKLSEIPLQELHAAQQAELNAQYF